MARKQKIPLKRLSMYIPTWMHEELKKVSEKRNESMTIIVLQTIIAKLEWERKFD